MSRYAKHKIRASWLDDEPPLLPTLTVPEHETIDTGLLWPDGETIWREPFPIGFGRDDEW